MPSGARPARLFLDANIIFSAAYRPQGRCAALFDLAGRGLCALMTSAYAAAEADRNLRHKKPEALKAFLNLLDKLEMAPEPDDAKQAEAEALGIDQADAPILAAALGRCDVLVTGDRRHFGRWMGKSVKGIQVLSPAEALAALLRDRLNFF